MRTTRLLGWKDLRERGIDWSRDWTLKQEKRGEFPQRVRLGPNRIAWCEDEIERWLQERSAARTGPPTRWAADSPVAAARPGAPFLRAEIGDSLPAGFDLDNESDAEGLWRRARNGGGA